MNNRIHSFGIIPMNKKQGKLLILVVKHVDGQYWGFPKGKALKGEVPHQTAKRELLEETGVEIQEMLSGRLFHESYTFEKQGVFYDKEVVYFPAFVSDNALVTHPDEVVQVKWCSLDQLESTLTYGPSKQVAKEFKQWIVEFKL
jgi:8-oxo-dGTP pyrophosphatase MutT (NUDIX family)